MQQSRSISIQEHVVAGILQLRTNKDKYRSPISRHVVEAIMEAFKIPSNDGEVVYWLSLERYHRI